MFPSLVHERLFWRLRPARQGDSNSLDHAPLKTEMSGQDCIPWNSYQWQGLGSLICPYSVCWAVDQGMCSCFFCSPCLIPVLYKGEKSTALESGARSTSLLVTHRHSTISNSSPFPMSVTGVLEVIQQDIRKVPPLEGPCSQQKNTQ